MNRCPGSSTVPRAAFYPEGAEFLLDFWQLMINGAADRRAPACRCSEAQCVEGFWASRRRTWDGVWVGEAVRGLLCVARCSKL
jgi:hypothetical protein